MDLSNNLISQFAKLTTGDKDKNKETTVYGTVKIYDGKTCVKLDGSDLLTPVDTTTEVKEGQRVAVLVKNHSAVIMGNTSDPSAGLSTTDGITEDVNYFRTLTANNFTATNATIENLKATKAEIKDLEAANATIENLKATKAEIKDLEVTNATIENLKTTKAEITDLEATNATIRTLEANKANIVDLNATNAAINDLKASKADIADLNALDAEIDNLSSNFATIQQLNATNANINTLDAEVADIQTLVNGNLTSDNISSLNLTSANTTVANAFIKDAMIDSVTASKLTAGIIDTSAITIKSTDGSMLITGSVQQFKDENGKVRIQIGKDSGGNFTFILYDESGTGVLIDESGIKSSNAIADGLIVDSKVAENANISGSKLDIASVITEVNNDNSTTIKSNKIYLNEQGQSLEVAFNSLKTHVDTIQDESIDGDLTSVKEQVQSNTTQINVNTSGISTLVSQNEIRKEEIKNLDDEITEVSTDINSKYTSLQQDLSGFKTTVGETYTTKTEFNGLTVGGRNLVTGTKDYRGWASSNSSYVTLSGEYNGFVVQVQTGNWSYYHTPFDNTKMKVGESYTLSVYLKCDVKSPTVYVTFCNLSSTGDANLKWITDNVTSEWQRFSTTIDIDQYMLLNATNYGFRIESAGFDTAGMKLYVAGIKFEKGNKATDWTPAPEDVQNEINDVSNNLTTNYSTTSAMNSAINQKANEITSSVSQTYATKQSVTDVSNNLTNNYSTTSAMNTAINQKANEITSSVSQTYATKQSVTDVSNNLTNNYSTTSAMNSAINQKANEITSSVSQTYATKQSVTDVSNNLTNNYSTTSAMNSAINQKANEITSSVSQTYATKAEFSNLQVGGRNLVTGTKDYRGWASSNSSYVTLSGEYNGFVVQVQTGDWSYYHIPFDNTKMKVGESYTLSVYLKCDVKSPTVYVNFCNWIDGSSNLKWITDNVTSEWQRFSTTIDIDQYMLLNATNYGFRIESAGFDTAGMKLYVAGIKFEKGNKATDWTPAPEDVQGEIDGLSTRMQTAESKLTKDSLTTTIGDYYTTESKISSYGYATTSQVTQTKNELTATFKSVGGYNLIKNSCGYGGTRGWTTTGNIYNYSNAFYGQTIGIDTLLYISNATTSEIFAYSPRFELKPNTTYTLSGYIWKSSNVTSYEVYILTSTSVTESDTGTSHTNSLLAHSNTAQSPTYFEYTFTTVANTMSGIVRIDHNGYNNSGNTTSCDVDFTGLCLVEGSVAKPWSPHPSETYSATTTVDAKGIKVTHTNAVGYTQMDANGFYLNDGSKNVLSVTSSGANFDMPVNADLITTGTLDASKVTVTNLSASSIATGTLSGSRISGGKISATDEISFVGGARIFGNVGELDKGLEISAAGIILGGGSINYLKGTWFVIQGDFEVEEGDLVINSGYKIDCDNIESAAISCTSITASSSISCTSVTASSNIDCSGIIYGRGNISLDRGSIWTALDGTVTRDVIRFNNNLLTSDSSSSSVYVINTNGDFCTLRASRVESGGDVTCWNLWAGGKVYANNVALTSDKRLKTDIRYVNIDEQSIGESGLMSPNVNITTKDMLEFIESIPFASYRMKNEVEKDIDYTYYGFIAQDLLETKVGSELIEHSEVIVENKTYDEDGRERIEYTTEERLRYSENKFIAFLAGAVQEDIKQRKAADKELMDMLNTIINE